MLSLTIRLMRKSARMLIPAGIAILIGTAFIASTFLFSNAMTASLTRQTTAQFGGADYMIAPKPLDELDNKALEYAYTRSVGDFHIDRMRATEGVDGVRVDASATVTVTNGDRNVNVQAIAASDGAKMLPVKVTHGDQPADNHEIALPQSAANQLGVKVGDTVTIDSQAAHAMRQAAALSAGTRADSAATADAATPTPTDVPRSASAGDAVRVVGITTDPDGAYPLYGGAAVLSDADLAVMAGVDDFSSMSVLNIYLDVADTSSDAAKATIARVEKLLPRHYTIQSRADAADASVRSMSGGGTDITTTFLLSFGVLAMLVAALVIANTFQVLVAQRRRTLALLRTIGARKGQLYASVLLEAGILGLIASALGVLLGIGLMAGVGASGLMSKAGLERGVILSWQVFVVPILFGVIMTIIASLGSARSATAVTPLEALRPIELTTTRRAGILRAVLSTLMLIAGLAGCWFGAWQIRELNAGHDSLAKDNYGPVLLVAITGCAFVFLALVLSATFWLPVLMRGTGALVSLTGPSARIAHANIQKNPRRVAATGVALLIGVTLVSTIATGAASGKQTMAEAISTRYSVDMIATGSDMTDAQIEKASTVKGVTASLTAPTAAASAKTADGKDLTILLVGVKDTASLTKVMHADLKGVELGTDDVLLPAYSATDGRKLTFPANRGTTFTIASADGSTTPITLTPKQADYRRVSSDYGAVAFIDADRFGNGGIQASGRMLMLAVDDRNDTPLITVLTDVQAAFSANPGITVTGPVAERAMWETIIDVLMSMLVGLIAVAVLIALVGVANTLSLSVIERTRESATLRAIGMTRGQLKRSLAVESLLLSLVSGIVGVILGTGFGWLGSYMVFSLYGKVALPFEWTMNGTVLAVAALAALIASIAPARRAVRTPPVEALAEA
ncbi:ABC transporter permease [Bifidobacterium sp. UTCIF-37]|uniref:ABC transporter permease n=1 Tax=unclassified Bifidobacterium TaxID=2608897 RepID=UPI00112E9AA0|nr:MULTISPECIES: FtsX-like permease family protein [unclassified Bifidobacterium]TPF86750.1 ABC transporter permease [Bifidobacterium sp. UTCIF-37]TPF89893.1 ABC transporter permease [Bifidobacterium sp. UTCIF-38]